MPEDLEEKVVNKEALVEWREIQRSLGHKVALTNGCFDLIHHGHLKNLQFSAGLADHLVVAVNGDDSVQTLKGKGRPLMPEEDRAALLAGFSCVSKVIIFPELRLSDMIRVMKPDLYVKGGDYTLETLDPSERKALEEAGAEIYFFPTLEGRSTSNLIRKIAESFR